MKTYNLNRNSNATIVYIEKLLYDANVCDAEWLEEINKMSETLYEDAIEIKNINTSNETYANKLSEFSALHKELASALEELSAYIKSEDLSDVELSTLDANVLVDNVKTTYLNYKNYYNNEIVGS